ncbi:pentapeptide repeat-containing protein [Blastococcus sp. TF02A-35]|uniref:pentapeptide repeat-containing protein n=1 Tax=Blastococcus sp. TF02A-35 TaxID=2559612 RepID=UPI001073F9B1|nr:pentapeptide repeat-containing protein [Blastococcus sp. TF02A_35]TFV48944.1 pentapeptide repeat-containing protein [Blastococcus sp. TF02A_35]
MDFSVRPVGRVDLSNRTEIVLSGRRLVEADLSRRHVHHFSAERCLFERCDFSGTVFDHGSFGAGRGVSEYVGCDFTGAKIHMGPGGFARFVDCTFEGASIDHWFCQAVELVDCTFSGRLQKAVFHGRLRPEDRKITGRAANQFEGNDFSRATLVDVSFRTGIDLSKQRLPGGAEYTHLKDARTAVRRARDFFAGWDDPEAKKRARGVLAVMEEDVLEGQEELLIRVEDYPRHSRPAIRVLLEAALTT